MSRYLRGALVEYGTDLLGPIPNVVLFQFNPETLNRTIQIPARPTGRQSRERSQAGEPPTEKISLTAHFTAADQLNDSHPLAIVFGVGTQLAALEKMAFPVQEGSSLIAKAIDAVGDALFGGDDDETPTRPIPRILYPKVLFIWGYTKILPVVIDSMTINEKQYDALLNPIQAEVSLGLSVMGAGNQTDDDIAKGAAEYTAVVKETMAVANLVNTVSQVIEMVAF
jgi:hypothetical protein